MEMPKRRLVFIASAVIALLALAFALIQPEPPSSVKLRLIKARREGGAAAVTYEIIGDTSCRYCLTPVRLEMKEETGWTRCAGSISGFSEPLGGLGAGNTNSRSSFYFTPQPPGAHLRLVVDVQRARRRPFWARLKLKFLGQNRQLSLDPFADSLVFTKTAAGVVCEEFVEP